jgi:hypothetical protein
MKTRSSAQCPILIEHDGRVINSRIMASHAEQPADVAMKLREDGWRPYRVRFDASQGAWLATNLSALRR